MIYKSNFEYLFPKNYALIDHRGYLGAYLAPFSPHVSVQPEGLELRLERGEDQAVLRLRLGSLSCLAEYKSGCISAHDHEFATILTALSIHLGQMKIIPRMIDEVSFQAWRTLDIEASFARGVITRETSPLLGGSCTDTTLSLATKARLCSGQTLNTAIHYVEASEGTKLFSLFKPSKAVVVLDQKYTAEKMEMPELGPFFCDKFMKLGSDLMQIRRVDILSRMEA